jgi:hypothetical protein
VASKPRKKREAERIPVVMSLDALIDRTLAHFARKRGTPPGDHRMLAMDLCIQVYRLRDKNDFRDIFRERGRPKGRRPRISSGDGRAGRWWHV